VDGNSQDFTGTSERPKLLVKDFDSLNDYSFRVRTKEFTLPTRERPDGSLQHQVVTLEGGSGAELLSALRLSEPLPGGLVDNTYLDPFLLNNPIDPLDPDMIATPPSYTNTVRPTHQFVGYLIGGDLIGFGSDVLLDTLGMPPCMKTIVVPLTRPTGFPMFIENRVVGQQQRVATMRRGPKTLPNLRLIPFPPRQ
jgi:hypothetical protein